MAEPLLKVWVAAWEMQCWGDPFAVGGQVESGLVADPTDSAEFLATPLGGFVNAVVVGQPVGQPAGTGVLEARQEANGWEPEIADF